MLGKTTLWVPGCDHAGIATQVSPFISTWGGGGGGDHAGIATQVSPFISTWGGGGGGCLCFSYRSVHPDKLRICHTHTSLGTIILPPQVVVEKQHHGYHDNTMVTIVYIT